MKTVIDVPVQGFCGGVSKAIQTVEKALHSDCPRPISVLGSLVHNQYVNQALADQGVQVLEAKGKTRLELLDQISSGTVIFTAHGISQAVRDKAAQKGLHIIDASCPFVLSTQKVIRQKLDEGCTIFYVGKKGHPEAEGAVGEDSRIFLIEKAEDIPDGIENEIFVTNQTTMSVLDLSKLFDQIAKKYPEAEFCNEICNATRIRQNAVLDLASQNIDVLVVVGDPASNNTLKLAETGRKAGIPGIIRVESAADLDEGLLGSARRVAITSGASTPAFLKDEVVKKIQSMD